MKAILLLDSSNLNDKTTIKSPKIYELDIVKNYVVGDKTESLDNVFAQTNADAILILDKKLAIQISALIANNFDYFDPNAKPQQTEILDYLHHNYLTITTKQGIEKIPLSTINYFKAEDKYIIACSDNKEYLINNSLEKMSKQYEKFFIQIHRKYLVAINNIQKLEKDELGKSYVQLKNAITLPVSRRNLSSVRKLLLKN